MKTWLKVLIGLAIIGIIAAFLVFKFYINKPHEDIEKATPAYTLGSESLWKQFNENQEIADSMYTGQVIEIQGICNKIDKSDSIVNAIFVMEIDSMFGDKSIRCKMLKKYNEQASALSTTEPVKIKGFCTGYNGTDIIFNKCSIVK